MQATARPLVSVIVPTFGRAHYIERAIDSILNQTYPEVEIIIVDDNDPYSRSRMDTASVLTAYCDNQSVRIINRESNGGGSAARNSGILACKGELITFLDDDDFYMSTKIEQQVNHIVDNGLDISLCNMDILDKGEYLDAPMCYAKGLSLAEFILGGVAFTPMIMCRASVIREVGGFHLTPRFQDHVLMIKLLEKGPRIGIIDQKLFVHNRHSEARITYSSNLEAGFLIRHEFERRNIHILDKDERKKVLLRHALFETRLTERRSGKLAGISSLMSSVKYVNSSRDSLAVLKTFGRLFVRPDTHF